jgi:hypothetical protein
MIGRLPRPVIAFYRPCRLQLRAETGCDDSGRIARWPFSRPIFPLESEPVRPSFPAIASKIAPLCQDSFNGRAPPASGRFGPCERGRGDPHSGLSRLVDSPITARVAGHRPYGERRRAGRQCACRRAGRRPSACRQSAERASRPYASQARERRSAAAPRGRASQARERRSAAAPQGRASPASGTRNAAALRGRASPARERRSAGARRARAARVRPPAA